jgi:uracil-DNA glycosylase
LINNWTELKFWQSGEWQVVEERLDDLERRGVVLSPDRHLMFAALDSLPIEKIRVVIMGQDPYPNVAHATGLAFSIPRSVQVHPPTLRTILTEYEDDLHYTYPKNGSLEKWAQQGVLLWNAIPSCEAGRSLSHDWDEWSYLTSEITTTLSRKGNVVFVLLGGVARRYRQLVDLSSNRLIQTSHPSPRGNLSSKTPFSGSRLFTTINEQLCALGSPAIDWKLEGYGWQPGKHPLSERLSPVKHNPLGEFTPN